MSTFFEMVSSEVWHQILAVFPICILEFQTGFGFGWPPPTLKYLLEYPNPEISLTIEETSWIASLCDFGRMFGPILSMTLLDILGRKLILQLGMMIHFLTWILLIFTRSATVLIFVRGVFGMSVGVVDVVTSIYIGENCSPTTRGVFTCVALSSFYLGVLIEYLIATYSSYATTLQINAILAFILVLSSFLLVETPQYLIIKGKIKAAEKNMMWLNGTKNVDDITSEFEKVQLNVISEKKKKTSLKEVFSSPANYKSLTIITITHAFHTGAGSGVFFVYVTIILQSTAFLTPFELTICYGVVQLIGAVVVSLIVEKFNRRLLAMFTFSGFVFCHSSIALVYLINDYVTPLQYAAWLIFFFICLFSCFNAMMDGLLYLIRGELFPQSIKSFGSGFAIITQSLFSFTTIKMFYYIEESFGMHSNFLLFAFISFAALWFIYFLLPETRGRTLVEIQKEMEKNDSKLEELASPTYGTVDATENNLKNNI